MTRTNIAVGLIAFFAGSASLWGEASDKVDFGSQIRPILSDRCYTCHGPDDSNRQADLRLDLEETAKEYAIIPGEPGESDVYLRISSADDDMKMPPADSKLSLTPDEIGLVRRWIEQGAPWHEHWSFVSPRVTAVPAMDDKTWPRNPIDHFVLARLRTEKLQPSPVADREKLIRRVTFDLTGLPPTLEEIDAFLADSSSGAYERLVDRLLESANYGERMATSWLDVARYSDTFGYQVDRDRFVWPWRDWVIKAFNDNMPYDEFVTCQLAGDLLPDATDDEILATTFNRLHPQKVEGGSVPEEFRIEYVADRTQTFATALLGVTLEFARCHDHKYDPFTQKEYYQLSAFFDNIDEAGLYSYFTQSVPTPTLLLADDEQKAQIADVEQCISLAERQLREIADRRRPAFDAWLPGARALGVSNDRSSPNETNEASATDAEVRPEQQSDGETGAAGDPCLVPGRIAHVDFEDHKDGANKSVAGKIGKAVQLSGDDGIGLKVGNFHRFDPFSVALWMNTPDEKQRAVVFHRSRAWTDAASRGYQMLIEDGCLSASLIHFWPGNAIRVRTREKIPSDQWLHVVVTYDGSSRADGLAIHVNGKREACDVVCDNLYKNITGGGGDNITIGERFRDRGFTNGLVDEFQVFSRRLTDIEVRHLFDGASLSDALGTDAENLAAGQREALYAYYLATADTEYQTQLAALRQVREDRSKTCDGISEIMVMRESSESRATYLLRRGAYTLRGDRVGPETPAVFPAFPEGQPRNRLGLAEWLTDPSHPLTARVAVNRVWQLCFGQGLVRTPEDFGSQGQSPTHPRLLDWLARDFIDHGWDVKRLVKMIVTSATYRQSSSASPGLLRRDPENRLLARAPSYRLPAEMLRDNGLAVSGLLVGKIGGPPARPYEVAVSFKPVERDKDEGLYRRSLYTYWKRTGPAPVMMTLDAAKRDVCRVRRERTSSPLQAFVLLNDPQFVEAAKMLAQRLIQQHGDNIDAITVDLFRALTSRRPTVEERKILFDLYQGQLAYFEENAERAEQLLSTGDAARDSTIAAPRLAATSVVASTLMNYDECVMKR